MICNINYRNLGYAEGYAAGINTQREVEYIYHTHNDINNNPCSEEINIVEGGCFTIPVMHSHSSECYGVCGGYVSLYYPNSSCNGCCWGNSCSTHGCNDEGGSHRCYCGRYDRCNTCGVRDDNAYYHNYRCVQQTTICGKNVGEIDGYAPSCGFSNNDIEGAIIRFDNAS